jgi:hypothetical protein
MYNWYLPVMAGRALKLGPEEIMTVATWWLFHCPANQPASTSVLSHNQEWPCGAPTMNMHHSNIQCWWLYISPFWRWSQYAGYYWQWEVLISWNLEVQYYIQHILPLNSILREANPVQTHMTILVLCSHLQPGYPTLSFPSDFQTNFVQISDFPHERYMHCPTHTLWSPTQ